jgi:UDP-N-acetylmuramoyl-L-alanyl-D-glutamate--2,6-diaminopimelate ligase
MNDLSTSYVADAIDGELIGKDVPIEGIFNILKDSSKGDAVIRHRIDEKGVEMAHQKDVSCIITHNISQEAVDQAQELDLPLIIGDKIEKANAFALKWAIDKYAMDTLRIVVTGTNGKSTTTHMIYTILQEAGYTTYTNTDSLSEFNTLIDPMVAKQIAEFPDKMDALVIEVSEVQGWMDRIMKDHAYQMTSAINPQMVVLTNVALDHIGLVNSIEEAYQEISGAVKDFQGKYVVLNNEDPLIKEMGKSIPSPIKVSYYGKGSSLEFRAGGIFHFDELIVDEVDLPFKSPHFIQNTLAAVQAALTLDIPLGTIVHGISSYQPLDRRFSILSRSPLIIDDFAHNPDGIKATIKSSVELKDGKIYLVVAIRGSRGDVINRANAEAVAQSLKGTNHQLILTSSADVVGEANLVKPSEKSVFTDTMDENGLKYLFFQELGDALKFALESSREEDTILLIGAQGMDPARELLKEYGLI